MLTDAEISAVAANYVADHYPTGKRAGAAAELSAPPAVYFLIGDTPLEPAGEGGFVVYRVDGAIVPITARDIARVSQRMIVGSRVPDLGLVVAEVIRDRRPRSSAFIVFETSIAYWLALTLGSAVAAILMPVVSRSCDFCPTRLEYFVTFALNCTVGTFGHALAAYTLWTTLASMDRARRRVASLAAAVLAAPLLLVLPVFQMYEGLRLLYYEALLLAAAGPFVLSLLATVAVRRLTRGQRD